MANISMTFFSKLPKWLERDCPGNSKWNLKILSPGFINMRAANEVKSLRPRLSSFIQVGGMSEAPAISEGGQECQTRARQDPEGTPHAGQRRKESQ